MKPTLIAVAAALLAPLASSAYEKAFQATKPGVVEFKTIPERTVIVAGGEGGYFEGNNSMFGDLFRYIQANDVSMTVPVKAEIDPGRMYFYLGEKDLAKDLRDNAAVKVVVEPARTVLSVGGRGSYSEKNFREAREKLYDELAHSKEWMKDGDAYAIYWNGPYVPGFMKKFEAHVPVVRRETKKDDA